MTDQASVYLIGGGTADQNVSVEEVGSKAFHLMQMDRMRLPIPPAFVMSTAYCRQYFEAGRRLPEDFLERLRGHMRTLEARTDRTFGGRRRPLLVSVRSGAPVSMPGMMETILNVGLTDESVPGLVRMTGNPRLAWDAYRRLIQSFAEVVHGASRRAFEEVIRSSDTRDGASLVQGLDTAALRRLAGEYLRVFRHVVGQPFPQDVHAQLLMAVEAVFRSWDGAKAREYRRVNHIPDTAGTAATVQSMVFGNAGGTSGAGVGFTRDPATGNPDLYVDFVFNAQGEDVVSGRRALGTAPSLAAVLPDVHAELRQIARALEDAAGDMQDFEFTVEQGQLHILQTRAGKRTPWAALRIATDMVREGLITPSEGLKQLSMYDLESVHRTRLSNAGVQPDAHGMPASVGVAVGRLALSNERAAEFAAAGEAGILVRRDIATEDIAGISNAEGVVALRGARTSHAAVVARQLGKVCLVGCSEISIRADAGDAQIGARTVHEGDWLSVDGNTGDIFIGRMEVRSERPEELLEVVARWRLAGGNLDAARTV